MEQRDLRDLTRYRTRLTAQLSSASNRLQKIMEDANVKLSSVATDIQGVSSGAILEALISGQTDAAEFANLAKGRLRNKIPDLQAALSGRIWERHCFIWREVLDNLDDLNGLLATLSERIRQWTAPHEDVITELGGDYFHKGKESKSNAELSGSSHGRGSQ